jgi:solute carrier family 12 (sodium/potassium/chloride transporter), member 2
MSNAAAEVVTPSGGPRPGYAFGTFTGVFTPSILTILGVIMYLRFPWVLGSVGLRNTIVIVTLSVAITLITGLSISAMATNMKVGGGGAYYMISRTLGVEVGAAVGLPLFLAQALGIAFYTVGFSETVVGYLPQFTPEAVSVTTLLVLTLIAFFSAELALKTQFLILALLTASLVSLFMGGAPRAAGPEGIANLPGTFWLAFAVFFPAVTGIEAGLAMSGDLKNPARSLVVGTLAAVLVSYVIYLAIPIFLSRAGVSEQDLLDDTLVLIRVARWPELVVAGILGATLSSALGALLGAPRTLQALAHDAVLPRIVGGGSGVRNDPRLATVIAFMIALVGVALGDLNAIAPILSMFFLTSYAVLNLSSSIESLIGSPAWRPLFRVPWWVSMCGFFGCLAAMLMINAGATLVAIVITLLVYYAMQRRELASRWGDVRYGLLVLIARLAIGRLARRKPDARSWSPNVLVLAGAPSKRWHLIVIAEALAGKSGLLTVATVVPASLGEQPERLRSMRRSLEEYLDGRNVAAFVKLHADRSVSDGLISLVDSYGFGPLVPNTVVMGKADHSDDLPKLVELFDRIRHGGRNLVIVHEGEELGELERGGRLDIWWNGRKENLGLMVALAFLLKRHPIWEDASVVIHRLVDAESDRQAAEAQLRQLLSSIRFEAEIMVVAQSGDRFETMRQQSRDADLVLMGMDPRDETESREEYGRRYLELARETETMPATALVVASGEVDLHRLFAAPQPLSARR